MGIFHGKTQLLMLIGFAVCLFGAESRSDASVLTLVDKGRANYSIVLPEEATAVEKFAARELQRYLKQISNTEIPFGRQKPNHIYIGASFSTRFNADFNFTQDGFLILAEGEDIFIAGVPDRGTLYGVYELLELIGCRWFAPDFSFYGDAGREYVPQRETIQLSVDGLIQEADFKYRTKNIEEGWSHTPENTVQLLDWMAKNRMNVISAQAKHIRPRPYEGHVDTVAWNDFRAMLIPEMEKRGIVAAVGGHGYQTYLPQEQYFSEHPEWFGMIDGERTRNPHVVFNTSNPEAVRTFTSNIIQYLSDHPEIQIFLMWPPDSETWSEDEASKSLGPPSIRHALLVNHVAKAIEDTFTDVQVEFIAYRNYHQPPEGEKFHNNLLMDYTEYARTYQYPIHTNKSKANQYYDKILNQWAQNQNFKGDIGIYSYYRKYIWRSLPVVIPHTIHSDIAYYHSLGVNALSSYSEPADWLTYELNHYVIARALWDSKLDVDSLIADYCKMSFDGGWEEMHEYFRIVEETVPHATRIYQSELYPLLHEHAQEEITGEFQARRTAADVFKPLRGRLSQGENLLEQARKKTTKKYQKAWIDKLYFSWKYASMDAEVKHLSAQLMEMGDKRRLEKINTLTGSMKNLLEKNRESGVFLMNFYVRF